jgi:hypothetical protein
MSMAKQQFTILTVLTNCYSFMHFLICYLEIGTKRPSEPSSVAAAKKSDGNLKIPKRSKPAHAAPSSLAAAASRVQVENVVDDMEL